MTIEDDRRSEDEREEPAEQPAPEPEEKQPEPEAREPAEDAPEPEPAAPAEPSGQEETEGARDEGAAPPPADDSAERPPARREPPARGERAEGEQPEVVPGADLEPDLVLDEPRAADEEFSDAAYAGRWAEPEQEAGAAAAPEAETAAVAETPQPEPRPAPRSPRELAADARYQATGKRKTSVARVILKPGGGTYTVNGRSLEEFFPRPALQATARQPLAAAGYETRMDVVARLHGGGVSSQAGALRHGVARALVEADPNLREELKRRGYLTRDPRAKERKKAGLKKARKRPQFSKR